MRYSRTTDSSEPMYLSSTAVVMNELLKLVSCLAILLYEEKGNIFNVFSILHREIIAKPDETLKMGVPSFLYTVQNNLLFIAVSHLDAATFQVTYQLKIITTALFSVIMLGKRLTRNKWLALVVLMVGVAFVQMPAPKSSTTPLTTTTSSSSSSSSGSLLQPPNPSLSLRKLASNDDLNSNNINNNIDNGIALLGNGDSSSSSKEDSTSSSLASASSAFFGLSAVITACISSGFAGVYFEKILKGTPASIWVRNVQLGLFGAIIGVVGAFYQDGAAIAEHGFFQGYNTTVWIVIIMQAVGGLLVAVVVKYADNILKGFATSVSIVVSSIFSIFLFGFYPHLAWNVGAALVLLATYMYSLPDAPAETRRVIV